MENDYISYDDYDPVSWDTHPKGFESWDDFNAQCDAMEESCKAFD